MKDLACDHVLSVSCRGAFVRAMPFDTARPVQRVLCWVVLRWISCSPWRSVQLSAAVRFAFAVAVGRQDWDSRTCGSAVRNVSVKRNETLPTTA